jgi:hypothetical protein
VLLDRAGVADLVGQRLSVDDAGRCGAGDGSAFVGLVAGQLDRDVVDPREHHRPLGGRDYTYDTLPAQERDAVPTASQLTDLAAGALSPPDQRET